MIETSVRQPVTVAVGVLLVLLAGLVALQRIPIQLTPNVEDTIVSVSTFWEGASPREIEQEIVDEQEDKLLGLSNLRALTSSSQQGTGTLRLEFNVGTPKAEALREVSDKLRQVPDYPEGADEPVIEASDPDNRDFIAWVVLQTTDPDLDIRDLLDFVQDRVVPILERIEGMSEVNALGGREREVQIRFDPQMLAQRGIAIEDMVSAIQRTNQNRSAGKVPEAKSDVRLRLVSQYANVRDVEETVVAETPAGPVRLSDIASVVETFKEPRNFVRSRGRPVIAINFQREVGSNVMQVMDGIKVELERLNAPGGLLERHAQELGLDGELRVEQVYDQTIYIDDALALVRQNIWIGGALATLVLVLFLRSVRSAGIIALAIPISIVGAVVAMVALGRSVNVVSLAGMAFAVGMVVDNAIVVLENVYRHLEMGKPPMEAAVDGTREVFGAILASTLTTVCVFIPILMIEEEAGQLFRDIALAIVAAVSLSLVVSVTVIPTCAARLLSSRAGRRKRGRFALSNLIGGLVHWLSGSVLVRVAIVLLLTAASLFGTWKLMPPADYLPAGNRNLVFGLLIPPPGYNLDQRSALSAGIEAEIRPYWEAGLLADDPEAFERALAELPEVPTFDFMRMAPGDPIVPTPLENYFIVAFEDVLFHGAIATEPEKVADLSHLFAHATRSDVAPGILAFAFQVPLFQLGGSSGSAVKINFAGDDLDRVSGAALAVFMEMMQRYGPGTTQPDPANFNIAGPELRVIPDLVRLSEAGLSPAGLGLAIQAVGDGAIIGEYEVGGQTIDLKLVSRNPPLLAALGDTPLATPTGELASIGSLAQLVRTNAAAQINRVSRQRSVTLQFTPQGIPLEQAVEEVALLLEAKRSAGVIPPDVQTSFTGSASKLEAVRSAMLGDGTLTGTLSSSLVLALLVVYLLMCVLFQSFLRPAVILFSVPLATLGGFAALFAVFLWSLSDPYMPIQNLDVLTMLGFVILIGVVVNNAILIVHQSLQFMRGTAALDDGEYRALAPREAIAEATKSRVRPIFMGTLTSVGGMAPLVLMPGSGSELYRGLGSVVLGGLLVSTIFTLLLVPLLFSLLCDLQAKLGGLPRAERTPALARAGVLLFAFVLVLAGCRSATHDEDLPAAAPTAEELRTSSVERAVGDLGPSDESVLPLAHEPSDVPELLAPLAAELEAMGGPVAWRGLEPDVRGDLLGREQDRIAVSLDRALGELEQHNVALTRARLAPRVAEAEAEVAAADFDSVFFSDAEHQKVDQPQVFAPGVGSFVTNIRSRRSRLSAGLRRRLGSGALVEASTFLERFDSKTSGVSFDPDPAWRSGLSLSVEQPLLRGYGRGVNESDIELALNRAERDRELLAVQTSSLVLSTEVAYWDLWEVWQRMRVLEKLADEGKEVERVLRLRRDFDTVPAQYSDALATVERRKANLVRARLDVRLASDRLKGFVQSPSYPPGSEVMLEPADVPRVGALEVRPAEALRDALLRRPELRAALFDIEDQRIRERVARSLELPDLALLGQVALLGEDDAIASANEELDDFIGYLVGLSFELPVGNRAARAEVRRSRLLEREAVLRHEQAALDVVLEVKAALRELEASFSLIGATEALRLAATENLRTLLAEEAVRSELTPEFLALKFQRQELLAAAQLDELEAIGDYNRGIASYRRATASSSRER